MDRGRVGEDRASKETDGRPLTLPLIVTLVITLELEQVLLQAVVTHSAIQYGLDLVLLLAVDKSCGWG
jgi:hypothetical protein